MKRVIWEFMRRGFVAFGFGPLVLAVLYWILYHQGVVEVLSVPEICLGIFSLSVLAFIAGGMNVIYQIEQIPLMVAIFIHGGVLYTCYLAVYLVNGWLGGSATPILVFSGIFLLGYLMIWIVIYAVNKRNTTKINHLLEHTHHTSN